MRPPFSSSRRRSVAASLRMALVLLIPGLAGAQEDPRWLQMAQLPAAARPSEVRWQERASLAWALFEAHPADPRRWAPWLDLLRSAPRFAADPAMKTLWAERTARLENAVEASDDAPEPLREFFASRKVSALVLPFTDGTLPADWSDRLVPTVEALAARYPYGTGAFVYFSRLVSAVEAQDPAALPALVGRLEKSPSPRVSELGANRRRVLLAMKQPLDLKFTALDGRVVDTAAWRGKVVLVDFWASWCVPCVQAMPKLKKLHADYHSRGLEIIGVSVDNADAREALVKLVAKLELPWPQAFDGQGNRTEYAMRYGVQPIPHVLLAGPDGKIVAVNPAEDRLEAEIRRLLGL